MGEGMEAQMTDLYAIMAGLLALVAGALVAFNRGRKAERQETALEAAERMAKQHKVRDEIDSDIRPANAADELRRDWSK